MTYQAIETKYYGPTNHRPSRIKAYAQSGRVWVNYDHGLNTQQNHAAAAIAFLHRWEWDGLWVQGANAANTGYVFVQTDRDWKGRDVRGFLQHGLTDEF